MARSLTASLLLTLLLAACGQAEAKERWAVYYTDKAPVETFESFDLLVFDSDHHPPLAPLKAQGKTILGYLSLGEAETYRSYFGDIKKKGLLLAPNPHWKGHIVVDIRKPEWEDMVVNRLIPDILAKGFDGIMFDTADSVIQPEFDDPVRYKGMQQATIDTIRAVRKRHPQALIMLNRGFDILPQVAGDIDMVMAESIYTDWQPNKDTPDMVLPDTYKHQMEIIQKAQEISPRLKVYAIDYWPLDDIKGVKAIYAHQRALGFIPYVSTVDLQSVYPEPR